MTESNAPSTWPFGQGPMARLIRDFDWAATPLGLISSWPESLRVLIDLMIDSPSMMSLLWGREAIQIYNDAYAVGIGERHPSSLGRPAFDNFADVRETFEPLFLRAWQGESVNVPDLHFRFEPPLPHPEGWFDLTYQPVRGAQGETTGVLAVLSESTARVQAQAAAAHAEERASRILENMSDAHSVLDHEFRIVSLNAAAERTSVGRVRHSWAVPIGRHSLHR